MRFSRSTFLRNTQPRSRGAFFSRGRKQPRLFNHLVRAHEPTRSRARRPAQRAAWPARVAARAARPTRPPKGVVNSRRLMRPFVTLWPHSIELNIPDQCLIASHATSPISSSRFTAIRASVTQLTKPFRFPL